MKPLKIVSIAAETAPFSKAGGLGDVARSLPKALKRLGNEVIAITPLHGVVNKKEHELKKIANDVTVQFDEKTILKFDLWKGYLMRGLPIYFIDRVEYFSSKKTIYGSKRNNERWYFFDRCVLEVLKMIKFKPDIIQCHDWHTGLVFNFLKKHYKDDEFFKDTAAIFTIHNLVFQMETGHGHHRREDDGNSRLPSIKEEIGVRSINLAKRGIIYADLINTVSEKYAEEILTKEFGEDLHRILQNRKDKILGIVNGIDYNVFNPQKDPALVKRYNEKSIDKKMENKLALQKSFKLPQNPNVPLLGMVTRITEQKGFDLFMEIADHLLRLDLQFVITGSGGDKYERFFKKLQKQYPKKAGIHLKFDIKKASQIYAGSDIFLMPSRFEPCGLGQLISMRYGSIPVVRATGGLVDTVEDFNPRTKQGNGFVFKGYDSIEFLIAVTRALENYHHKTCWRGLVKRAMKISHSWEIPAEKYLELFKKAIKLHNKLHNKESNKNNNNHKSK
ncbi:glycogen synthase [Patescibacteria group bacterium]|nr:glycogen synthase [Patescibacteria group bacterium]MBU4512388.1 glycogen synthase [Patescibacteria group bacterium]MCG2692497.1 glycogen synthase [Candidatus Parcubacteria bacterium]